MKTYRDFQWYEWKRFFRNRNLIVFAIVLALSLIFTWSNVSTFKSIQDNKEKFQEFEKKKVKHILNYRMYGMHGFRIITFPAPMAILSLHSSPFIQLTAKLDTTEHLNVYRVMQSNDSLRTSHKWFLDFSTIILVFGSFLALMYGFGTFWYSRYFKLLTSFGRKKSVLFSIAFARSLILGVFFLVALVLNYVLIAVRGVTIPLTWSLPSLFVSLILMAVFFYLVGALLGMVKDKHIAFFIGFSVFFLSLFGVSALTDHLAFGDEGSIPSMYEIELKKMKIFNDSERILIKKHGTLKMGDKPTKERTADWDRFLNNEYKEIQAYNDKMIKKIRDNANRYKWLSALFPTSYFFSVNNELSGSGYDNLVAFFKLVKKIKIDFFLKYIEVMRTNPNATVEQFLNGDDNIIQSKPNIPGQFPLGTLITIIYILVLFWWTSGKFKKTLYSLPKKDEKLFDGVDVKLKAREITEMKASGDLFSRQMYGIMAGWGKEFTKQGYSYKVTMDGKDLVTNTKKLDFLYICHRDHLPTDIKTGDLLSLLMHLARTGKEESEKILSDFDIHGISNKRIKSLTNDEFGRLLLAMIHIKPFYIYILDDIIKEISLKTAVKLKDCMETLAIDNDAAFLMITTDLHFAPGSDDSIYFNKRNNFMPVVADLEKNTGKE